MGDDDDRMLQKSEEQPIIGALRKSGFPFQTAIANLVNTETAWKIRESEYPWRDLSGADGFLDLIASDGAKLATIECRKTEKEKLIFLRPLGAAQLGETDRVRCLHVVQVRDALRRLENLCKDFALWPRSFEAEFCVVSTDDSGRKPHLLEPAARTLIRATDAFARDEQEKFRPDRDAPPQQPCLILPIIVTNAPLYVARYRPADVSLETGIYPARAEDVRVVPWIRFKKAFTSEGGRDLGDRTVFVVRAESLKEFLDSIEIPPDRKVEPNSVHLPRRPGR